jgi:FkbM family methyltransferase
MKLLMRRFLTALGFELRRLPSTDQARSTHEVALRIAVRNGLHVNTVIDVGAAFGDWTRMCMGLFPQAKYILIEPLAQYDEWLRPLLNEFPNVTRVKAAAADRPGQATFFFHEDWVGSSLYHEAEGPLVDGTPLQVDTTTIDEIVQQQKLSGPFLLKIDVQGAELQVLEGAPTTSQQTEYLLVETSFFEFFKKGPLIHDVIAYMRQREFVIYDILSLHYRLLDNALGQVDLAFVPEHSLLRREQVYASPHQRQRQTKQIKRRIESFQK